jgi:hypothetical protein
LQLVAFIVEAFAKLAENTQINPNPQIFISSDLKLGKARSGN